MLPAFRRPMRPLPALLAACLLAACGTEETTISGTLDPELAVTHVWVLGGPERAVVDASAFRIEGIVGDTVDLRFADEDGERGRMRIEGVPPGAVVELREVWVEEGRAFPARVTLEGVEQLTINGLRYAPVERLDDEIEAEGEVLSVSDDGDALLVRPADGSLPDLRIVITPGSRILSPDGEPLEAESIASGDSIRLRASREGSYFLATELVLPRENASRDRRRGEDEAEPVEEEETAAEALDRSLGITPAREERGRGKGKGKGKGRGRGKDGG